MGEVPIQSLEDPQSVIQSASSTTSSDADLSLAMLAKRSELEIIQTLMEDDKIRKERIQEQKKRREKIIRMYERGKIKKDEYVNLLKRLDDKEKKIRETKMKPMDYFDNFKGKSFNKQKFRDDQSMILIDQFLQDVEELLKGEFDFSELFFVEDEKEIYFSEVFYELGEIYGVTESEIEETFNDLVDELNTKNNFRLDDVNSSLKEVYFRFRKDLLGSFQAVVKERNLTILDSIKDERKLHEHIKKIYLKTKENKFVQSILTKARNFAGDDLEYFENVLQRFQKASKKRIKVAGNSPKRIKIFKDYFEAKFFRIAKTLQIAIHKMTVLKKEETVVKKTGVDEYQKLLQDIKVPIPLKTDKNRKIFNQNTIINLPLGEKINLTLNEHILNG